MLIRNTQGQVEAAAKDDLDKTKYTWHVYTSARGTKFNGTKGTASLKKGDYFGVKEFTSKDDKVLILNSNLVFKLAIDKSDKLMGEKGKECKGGKLPKGALKVEAPKKIKINVDEKPAAKPKAKKPAEAKPAKVKLTANQKAIAALKAEIKRIKGMTQNNANLRKIAKLKEDLKKKQAKETAATPKTSKAPKAPKATKKAEIIFQKTGTKLEALLNDKIVVTGYKLSDGRYNVDYKFIGGKQAKIEGPISNVKAKVKQRIEKYFAQTTVGDKVEAPARVKEPSKPVNPAKEAKRTEKKPVEKKPASTPKAEDVKLAPEYEAARKMLEAIDKGGVPLNPVKLNNVGRELGLDISRSAKPEDTIERIRSAVKRAIESARAEQKHAAPKKVKITVTPSDDDDDAVPHGHVRYGGKLIEPDELEFDDDVSGLVDLPIDQSWSSNAEETSGEEINMDSHDSQFVSRRPH